MSNIITNSFINKVEDDIREAIIDVGGEVPAKAHLCEYSDIIRNQLYGGGRTELTGNEGEYIITDIINNQIIATINKLCWVTEAEVDSMFDNIFK